MGAKSSKRWNYSWDGYITYPVPTRELEKYLESSQYLRDKNDHELILIFHRKRFIPLNDIGFNQTQDKAAFIHFIEKLNAEITRVHKLGYLLGRYLKESDILVEIEEQDIKNVYIIYAKMPDEYERNNFAVFEMYDYWHIYNKFIWKNNSILKEFKELAINDYYKGIVNTLVAQVDDIYHAEEAISELPMSFILTFRKYLEKKGRRRYFRDCDYFIEKKRRGKRITEGGFGEIFFGKIKRPDGTEKEGVIKLQKLDKINRLDNIEKEILRDLGSKRPQIVPRLLEVFNCENNDGDKMEAIVMERMNGDIIDYIEEKGRITERLIRHLLRIMNEFHRYGYIHWDTKIDNFLYKTRDGKVAFFLTDFSFAQKVDKAKFANDEKYRRAWMDHIIVDYYYLYLSLLHYGKNDRRLINKMFNPVWCRLKKMWLPSTTIGRTKASLFQLEDKKFSGADLGFQVRNTMKKLGLQGDIWTNLDDLFNSVKC